MNSPWTDPYRIAADYVEQVGEQLEAERQRREKARAVAARSRMNRAERRAADLRADKNWV